jgi:hypothetical protein
MTKTFNTKYGIATLRFAMFDINGTDLVEGIEVKLDDVLIGEVYGFSFDQIEDMSISEVENFIDVNCHLQ